MNADHWYWLWSWAATQYKAHEPSPAQRHRETKTQNLGQLNLETKDKKNIFGGHFDAYTKMIRKRRNGFLNSSQNVL